MAEMLIDGAKLDACNAAEADAIRAKTGGTDPIPYDYENNRGFADVIAAIPSGINMGLEVTSFRSDGRIVGYLWHGETVPAYACSYNWYNGTPPTVSFKDKVVDIGDRGFADAFCWIDFSTLQYLETAGEAALTIQPDTNTTEGKEITLPLYTGLQANGSRSGNTFRVHSSKYIKKMHLPKMQYIGNYVWYQRSVADSEIEIGSIGYPVLGVSQRPFGYSSNTGTVTVYTTGALLDTIRTAIQDQASANYTWIYKAAEATKYGGASYAAGDTMLTVGGA